MLALSAVPTVVRNEIRALLSESGDDIDHLADDDQLHDLGLNSLLLARLIIQLEIELGVDPFSEDVTISDARSVGALVGAYERALTRADRKDGSGSAAMPHDALVVVGDRFKDFLANRGTISASALLGRLRDRSEPRNLSVLIGQGLTAEQLSEAAQLVESDPDASVMGGVPAFVEQGVTHKHNPKNVMIGTPVQVAADRFVADLLIDERTEVLEDHLTGQHIPAITLMEAARQTWTAVTEMFFLQDAPPQRFVISSMQSVFHKYVFPLPATVAYQLMDRQDNAVGQVFACSIGVYQADVLAAQIDAEYRLIPEVFSAKHESMAARQAVASQLGRMEQAAEKLG